MRVLHVLDGLHTAGIETLALQLIARTPDGVRADLLNTDRRVQQRAEEFAQLQRNGQLQAIHDWQHCDRLRLAWRTFRLCRKHRFDALLLYPCKRPMLWLALGARLAGVKRMAVALQNTAPHTFVGKRTWTRLLLWFQRLGVVVVPCTQAVVDSLDPLPNHLRLGAVLLNGCDVQIISQRATAARGRRPADDPSRVLMVGRLDPIKDQDTLIRAFAAIHRTNWKLQLVGSGPELPRLEALARELGLDVDEIFLGNRTGIPDLLGQADLFAFSTTPAEGFGIALIEAMAAGLPIIASDVPACREVLKNGAAGELVAAGDVSAWANKLENLMLSSDKRRALADQSNALANSYDISLCAKKWMQLLSSNQR